MVCYSGSVGDVKFVRVQASHIISVFLRDTSRDNIKCMQHIHNS